LRAIDAGDTLAARIWDEACYFLALAAVNLRHLLNPELIVLSGGLINAGPRLLDRLQAHFERLSWHIAPDAPRIAFATLGTDAGTIGAAALARAELGA
jgi:glucokinase